MLIEVIRRVRFCNEADRLGPDVIFTHWKLHFKKTMLKLCKKKFKYFADSADFRPGAYAIGCSKISIGKNVVIRPLTMLHADTREGGAGITIEDDCLLGSGVHIYVDKHRYDNPEIAIIEQGYHDSLAVVLKNGCWIGANTIILPGVTIGQNSVVGAGSVVTNNVEPYSVVAGNPAKVIKNMQLGDDLK